MFAQIVTDEPLHSCTVLASVISGDREEAISLAMKKAGVTELVDGPRPQAVRVFEERTHEVARVWIGQDIRSCLAMCEEAVDGLIGAIQHD